MPLHSLLPIIAPLDARRSFHGQVDAPTHARLEARVHTGVHASPHTNCSGGWTPAHVEPRAAQHGPARFLLLWCSHRHVRLISISATIVIWLIWSTNRLGEHRHVRARISASLQVPDCASCDSRQQAGQRDQPRREDYGGRHTSLIFTLISHVYLAHISRCLTYVTYISRYLAYISRQAGALTGGVGAGLANPFDVVRVRMMMEGS